jgi:putative spermidine/putrescine transport system substrate-binding protein
VKFYSADTYLQPLTLGDTWVAVGWSSDIMDLVQKNPNIGAIVPRSGTAIWADLWVQPKSKNSNSPERVKLSQQWMDYCLQVQPSNQISLFTSGTAPLLTSLPSTSILPDIQHNLLILPDQAILAKSEFLYPLSAPTQSQYDQLWREIRQVKVSE